MKSQSIYRGAQLPRPRPRWWPRSDSPAGRPQHRPVVPSPPPRSLFSEPSLPRARNEPESVNSAPLSLRLGIALIPHLRPLRKRLLSPKLPRSSFCEKIKRKTQEKPRKCKVPVPNQTKMSLARPRQGFLFNTQHRVNEGVSRAMLTIKAASETTFRPVSRTAGDSRRLQTQ